MKPTARELYEAEKKKAIDNGTAAAIIAQHATATPDAEPQLETATAEKPAKKARAKKAKK